MIVNTDASSLSERCRAVENDTSKLFHLYHPMKLLSLSWNIVILFLLSNEILQFSEIAQKSLEIHFTYTV